MPTLDTIVGTPVVADNAKHKRNQSTTDFQGQMYCQEVYLQMTLDVHFNFHIFTLPRHNHHPLHPQHSAT